MGTPFRSGFLAGLVAGAALAGAAALIFRPSPPAADARPGPAAPPPSDRAAELERENRALARRVEDLEKARPAAPTAPAREKAAVPAAPAPSGVGELFAKLAELGLAGFRGPKYAEALEAVKKGGKASI